MAARIITDHWRKPIPTDKFDWQAMRDGYEPGDPVGVGSTEQAAIDDLTAQEDEAADADHCTNFGHEPNRPKH